MMSDRADVAETLDSCPLCSGTSFRRLSTPVHWIGREIFSRGSDFFGLLRCRSCSLAFVNPRPNQALLNAFYDCNNYACHTPEAGNPKTAQFLLECIKRRGPYEGRRFLDFGCGGGFLLAAARDDDWNATGYDVGPRALASCTAQGLTATGNLSDLSSSSFDVVFLNHVFEHLADPHAVLSQCRRLLKKNGKLFVVVPNLEGMRARSAFPFLSRHFSVDERHRAFPIHLFYFTPKTLSQTLERNSLQVVAVETFGLGINELINRPDAGRKGGMKVSTADPRRSRALREIFKRIFFRAGLGENLLVVAHPL